MEWPPTLGLLPKESHGQRSHGLQSMALQRVRHTTKCKTKLSTDRQNYMQ